MTFGDQKSTFESPRIIFVTFGDQKNNVNFLYHHKFFPNMGTKVMQKSLKTKNPKKDAGKIRIIEKNVSSKKCV